jgi:hypothetical protein
MKNPSRRLVQIAPGSWQVRGESRRHLADISRDATGSRYFLSLPGDAEFEAFETLEEAAGAAGVPLAGESVAPASYSFACYQLADTWVPANGGTETPFVSRSGRRLLYVWNPKQARHAYLDTTTDRILEDDEMLAVLGLA